LLLINPSLLFWGRVIMDVTINCRALHFIELYKH
jgi:hypothetical protein